MYQKKTDLALETRELHAKKGVRDGIRTEERTENGVKVTVLRVDPDGEEKAGKPAGTYVTLELGRFCRRNAGACWSWGWATSGSRRIRSDRAWRAACW